MYRTFLTQAWQGVLGKICFWEPVTDIKRERKAAREEHK